MNKKYIITTILSIGLFGGMIGAVALWPKSTCDASSEVCQSSNQPQQKPSKADTVQSELKTNSALLIDVREPDEFASGHAENAQNIPLGDIEAGKLTENNKERNIYIYCKSGRRAEIAKKALEKQGYTNVENLGGLSDWQSLGGKLVM